VLDPRSDGRAPIADRIEIEIAMAVVTLLEPEELTLLKVERLGEEVLRRNMSWFHLPIADVSTPDERFEQEWDLAGQELRSILRSGSDVLVHCRGGLGRAGTIAARLLVELGMDPATAIASVRKHDWRAHENLSRFDPLFATTYCVNLCTIASTTGGHTPFPSILIRSRLDPCDRL
jgi:protein-tyrosine phosphatase